MSVVFEKAVVSVSGKNWVKFSDGGKVYVSQCKPSSAGKGKWTYDFFHTIGLATLEKVATTCKEMVLVNYVDMSYVRLNLEDVSWVLENSAREKSNSGKVCDFVVNKSSGDTADLRPLYKSNDQRLQVNVVQLPVDLARTLSSRPESTLYIEGKVMDIWTHLLDRAFGGEDVAAAPGDAGDDFWPLASPAANADVVCERLSDAVSSRVAGEDREWVFLVGSAGNGKSVLAKQAAAKIDGTLDGDSRGLAKRTYDYTLRNGNCLKIVNDATIPPAHAAPLKHKNFLTGDLCQALESGAFMLACVNRGMLLKERLAIKENFSDDSEKARDLTAEIVNWILGGKTGDSLLEEPAKEVSCSYYKYASFLHESGVRYRVHVVYLDQVSLFEAAVVQVEDPWAADDGALTPGGYTVATFPDLAGVARNKSPAASLAKKLHCLLPAPPESPNIPSPIAANLEFLGSSACLVGWANMLRGAELRAGGLLTYREVWGLLVLGLVGPNRAEFRSIDSDGKPAGPNSWIRKRLVDASGAGGFDGLLPLIELANTRVHMALFGFDIPSHSVFQPLGRSAPTQVPTVRLMKGVDPVRDARPEPSRQGNVNEAMRAITLEKKPSAHLKEIDPEHPFCKAWQPFDDYLEDKILERVHELGIDGESRALQAWFGRYLYRLYGLSSGKPAFADVISKLEESWQKAIGNYPLPSDLSEGLIALVNGVSKASFLQTGRSMTLPLLAPKAEPISEAPEKALLALKIPTLLRFVPRVDGDQVLVDVSNNNIEVTTLVLDFDLCREALIYQGHGGFTERSHFAVPRVERVRAALLSKKVIDEMSAVPGMSPEPVAIKGTQVVNLV